MCAMTLVEGLGYTCVVFRFDFDKLGHIVEVLLSHRIRYDNWLIV